MADNFVQSLSFALLWEGGYVNHPSDPGGATNRGVTQGTYDTWRSSKGLAKQSVKLITDAEVQDIYKGSYWAAAKCDALPWPVCAAQFDAAVNTGVKQAAKLLQRAAGVTDDGIIGSGTLGAVGKADPVKLALACCDKRQAFYQALVNNKPSLGVFLKGWTNRVNALRKLVQGTAVSFGAEEDIETTARAADFLAELEAAGVKL